MTISRRNFFRKTSGAVAGAALVAMTAVEVEEHIEQADKQFPGDMGVQSPSDVYAGVSPNAIYYQVEASERVAPGDLLVSDDEGVVYKQTTKDIQLTPVGICISYDDQTKTCVMATKG